MAFMQSMALGVKLQVHTGKAINAMRKLGGAVDQAKTKCKRLGTSADQAKQAIQGAQMASAAINLTRHNL